MTDPLDPLRASLNAELGDRPPIAAMATVDDRGLPHVRNVVVRRIEAGTLWITSHRESAKNQQVRQRPAAELAFWLPGRREQFRVAGSITLPRATEVPAAWVALSDSARALFFWPSPGEPRAADPAVFPEGVGAEIPWPESFEVLVLTADQVERLELASHPHRRRCWRASTGWNVEDWNP